jgi:hypothetical protein
MQTETWIERLIVNQLTTHDRRYKHDYGGVEQTTDDLVAACAQLDAILTEDRGDVPSLEQLLSMEAAFESDVESALGTLQKKSLIERAGERERRGPPLEQGDYGTVAIWEPTVEGRAEAKAIHEAYATAVDAIVESHDEESEEFEAEIVSLARTYGNLPDQFVPR